MFGLFQKKRIYLDHAAATPLRPEVARVQRVYEREIFGNVGGVHKEGVAAHAALEAARSLIAEVLVTTPRGIVMTSGGTESNNLALFGVVEKLRDAGRPYDDMEIISTRIEHPSLLEPLRRLEKRGVKVLYVPIDSEGRIIEKEFASLLSPKTVLVSFAYANSEIGVVQDVKALSRMVRLERKELRSEYPYIHIDASQAPLWLPCRMDSLGIDMMSIDAGKCYGPKSVGVLALRGDVSLTPLLFGGSQEGMLRPGTENVGAAVGCAEALKIAQKGYEARASRVAALRDNFIQELNAAFPTLVVNGSREFRLANNANISIPGIDGEYAVIGLDHRGVACSTRSACKGNEDGGSHVLRSLGQPEEVVMGAIRFSLGEGTTQHDLSTTVRLLAEHAHVATQT